LIVTRYFLLRLIDQGAMGEVYIAKDLRLNTLVAIKFLKQALHSLATCDRFLTEAITCAQLSRSSKHIVQVTDFGTDQDDVPFLVMEYLQGQSLKDCLQSQPLPLCQSLQWIQQICLGLKCAHDGIEIDHKAQRDSVIHCDIKPSNIFITLDATFGELVKILDFGIARLLQNDNQIGFFSGTLPYASPEQMKTERLDPRSDIYSLGILMFEMLTCKLPLRPTSYDFEGWLTAHCEQPPSSLRELTPLLYIPKDVNDLVMSCLAKLPQDRPQSITEVLRVIRHTLKELKQSPTLPSQPFPKLQISAVTTVVASQETALVEQPLVFPPSPSECNVLCQPVSQPTRMPALWVKLPHELIQTIQTYRLYNEIRQYFRFCGLPQHPVMLWATAIGNPQLGIRWFTCFLDLKRQPGRDIVYLLPKTETYQYLFFDAESPHWLSHRMICRLKSEEQKQTIQKAAIECIQPSVGSFLSSQQQLRHWVGRLKPVVEQQMTENIQRRWNNQSEQ